MPILILNNHSVKLEICCTNLQSAVAAERAGADRIELCNALQLGGLTPSFALIKEVKDALHIPVNVLIRSREGNFTYDLDEQNTMLNDILVCKNLGINGIVIGCLTEGFEIDIPLLKTFIDAAQGMEITFHRAFDLVNNPLESLQELIGLKITRLLTSGQRENAFRGKVILEELVQAAENRIEIMAGSGINAVNAKELISFTKIGAIHCSAKKEIHSSSKRKLKGLTDSYFMVDEDEVRRLKSCCV
jgi:copper homeostasis protein